MCGPTVRLDASTVSRRRARVVVGPDSVRLVDLAGKNGTFRAQDRVTTSIELSDGDVVRVGSLALIIRVQGPSATTDTAV